jgi:phosphatidylserine/phosphatidylglycerophosphate/cardiolipin synthase-like enzyme
MSAIAAGPQNDDIVLVFRPPENPAAQMAGVTPFKSLRLRLDELLDWFKGLNVDSIDLWIEGAFKSGNRTELFLSVEGRTGAKLTLRPYLNRSQAPSTAVTETPPSPDSSTQSSETSENTKIASGRPVPSVSVVFSPGGGIERQVVGLIASAVGSIEMAAFELTNIYVEKALMEAIKRGVKITLVMDKSETSGEQARLHDALEKAGADVRLISPRRGRMRDNYIIVDGKTVEWGSYLYTERAENWNFENATFASDSLLAQQYHTDFQSLFNQAKPEPRGVRRSIVRFFRAF